MADLTKDTSLRTRLKDARKFFNQLYETACIRIKEADDMIEHPGSGSEVTNYDHLIKTRDHYSLVLDLINQKLKTL